MTQHTMKLVIPLLFSGAAIWAQGQPAGDDQNPAPPPAQGDMGTMPHEDPGGGPPHGTIRHTAAPPPPMAARPPMERAMPRGRWWNNPEMVQKLGLTSDQQKKMDDIFQQNRLRLIDLNASLQREEVTMEPLISADTPDEPKVLAQIDKIAQARAELEKANARFLLGIRRILTQEQWKTVRMELRPEGGRGPGQPAPPARR